MTLLHEAEQSGNRQQDRASDHQHPCGVHSCRTISRIVPGDCQSCVLPYRSLVLSLSAWARGDIQADPDGNGLADKTNTSELWSNCAHAAD